MLLWVGRNSQLAWNFLDVMLQALKHCVSGREPKQAGPCSPPIHETQNRSSIVRLDLLLLLKHVVDFWLNADRQQVHFMAHPKMRGSLSQNSHHETENCLSPELHVLSCLNLPGSLGRLRESVSGTSYIRLFR